MSLQKFYISILFSCFVWACNQPSSTKRLSKSDSTQMTVPDSTVVINKTGSILKDNIEDKIFDTIYKLKEVTAWGKYLEEKTNGKRHLKIMIYDTPHQDQNYYWVKAGEDNGMAFVSQFNFYVYPHSMQIKYYDTVTDSLLTLDKWRKQKK